MILVTGGAGYIGSHCALRLLRDGRDIVIFDSLELGHQEIIDRFSKLDLPGKLRGFVKGDLREPEDINKVFDQYDIEAVVHFAAYSQVAESVVDPGKYYRNNICGSVNLLDAMVKHNVKECVFSSTAAVYGEPEYVPIDENHPKNPVNPYGMSKLTVERIMDDYGKAFGLRTVRLRYFNVAGADTEGVTGEWHDPETHLIPNILLSKLRSGRVFSVFGTDYSTRDGTCVRDYINIDDLIEAHVLALDYLRKGGETDVFNLGTGNGSTVREVFSVCEDVVSSKIPLKECQRRQGDPAVLVADSSKAERVLGWKPKRSLKDSVSSAWNWHSSRE